MYHTSPPWRGSLEPQVCPLLSTQAPGSLQPPESCPCSPFCSPFLLEEEGKDALLPSSPPVWLSCHLQPSPCHRMPSFGPDSVQECPVSPEHLGNVGVLEQRQLQAGVGSTEGEGACREDNTWRTGASLGKEATLHLHFFFRNQCLQPVTRPLSGLMRVKSVPKDPLPPELPGSSRVKSLAEEKMKGLPGRGPRYGTAQRSGCGMGRTGHCHRGTEISELTKRVFCSPRLLTWETVLGGAHICPFTQIGSGGAKSSRRPAPPPRPVFWKTWPSGMGRGSAPRELGREVPGGELAFLGGVWAATGNTRRTV